MGDSQVTSARRKESHAPPPHRRKIVPSLRHSATNRVQRGGFAEGLALAPGSPDPRNTQDLLRSGIRAGNNPGAVTTKQARRHIARDFFR